MFGFVLGDVSGKGPPAALMSALMQGMFAAEAYAPHGPAAAVAHINQALCRRGVESRFVTLMFGLLSTSGVLTYCNAGHNPPLVLSAGGVRRLEAGGPVVGLQPQAPYVQGTTQLAPRDVILIFSDGVSEAFDRVGEEFGEARILEAAAGAADLPAQVLVDRIVGAVRAFTRDAVQSDDITTMVIRYAGPAA